MSARGREVVAEDGAQVETSGEADVGDAAVTEDRGEVQVAVSGEGGTAPGAERVENHGAVGWLATSWKTPASASLYGPIAEAQSPLLKTLS